MKYMHTWAKLFILNTKVRCQPYIYVCKEKETASQIHIKVYLILELCYLTQVNSGSPIRGSTLKAYDALWHKGCVALCL